MHKCCLRLEDFPRNALPFIENTLQPKNGYRYLYDAYHYVNPMSQEPKADLVQIELRAHHNTCCGRGKSILAGIRIIREVFLKKCKKFLSDVSPKNSVVDYTRARPIKKYDNPDEVVPLSFSISLSPEQSLHILNNAKEKMFFSQRYGGHGMDEYSIVGTTFFNVRSICLEVKPPAPSIKTYIFAEYMFPLYKLAVMYTSRGAYSDSGTPRSTILPLSLRGELLGTQKFYERTDQLTLRGAPLI